MMEYKTNRCYMTRIRNREMTRMPGAGRKRSGFRNGVLFSVLAAGAAVIAGITGPGYVTVLAADSVEQNQKMTADDSLKLTVGGTSGNVDDSVNLCSPSCALRSGNEEQRSELSPSLVEADKRSREAECSTLQGLTNDGEAGVQSVDGVSDSTYTFATIMSDGQLELFRVGLLAAILP